VEIPSLLDLRAAARVVAIPLTMRFRGITVREAMVFDGPKGWAEWAPFVEYGSAEAARWLAAAVEAGWQGLPAVRRASVPVNVIVPATDPDTAAALVTDSGGCRTAKVKVAEPGQAIDQDVARVHAVRAALDSAGPEGRIRVDANGGWGVDEAVAALGRLSEFGLEFVEQPCRSLAEQAELRRRVGVPLAVDEGLRKAVDPSRVLGLREAADVVVLKVAPLGGVRAALAVAEACALPAVVSSALDTSIGLAAGAGLAGALPELNYACGLGSGRLLASDVAVDRVLPVDGMVSTDPPVVSAALLDAVAAPADRERWWLARLDAAHAALVAGAIAAEEPPARKSADSGQTGHGIPR
jgi:o-succinylbenzoate synthase